MSNPTTFYDIAIVGAGISGLSARLAASRQGLSAVTLEKSRGLGGRCGTRRGEDWRADVGAQTLSSSGGIFSLLSQTDSELIRVSGSGAESSLYVHPQGMSAIAHRLKNLVQNGGPIELQRKVVAIEVDTKSHWRIECEGGERYESRALVLSIPLPQAAVLLERILPDLADLIRPARYDSCLAVGYCPQSPLPKGMGAILEHPVAGIQGIYDQRKKGLLTSLPVVVVQTDPEYSQLIWDEDDPIVAQSILLKCAGEVPGLSNSKTLFVHRWRYSELSGIGIEGWSQLKFSEPSTNPPIIIAGDTASGSSIDLSYRSGVEAAGRIAQILRQAVR